MLQQLFLADQAARSLDERHEQLEILPGDADRLVRAQQDVLSGVEEEGTELVAIGARFHDHFRTFSDLWQDAHRDQGR